MLRARAPCVRCDGRRRSYSRGALREPGPTWGGAFAAAKRRCGVHAAAKAGEWEIDRLPGKISLARSAS